MREKERERERKREKERERERGREKEKRKRRNERKCHTANFVRGKRHFAKIVSEYILGVFAGEMEHIGVHHHL
jgi:hypothetical protein